MSSSRSPSPTRRRRSSAASTHRRKSRSRSRSRGRAPPQQCDKSKALEHLASLQQCEKQPKIRRAVGWAIGIGQFVCEKHQQQYEEDDDYYEGIDELEELPAPQCDVCVAERRERAAVNTLTRDELLKHETPRDVWSVIGGYEFISRLPRSFRRDLHRRCKALGLRVASRNGPIVAI